jgi:predicted metal-binding membrane protein
MSPSLEHSREGLGLKILLKRDRLLILLALATLALTASTYTIRMSAFFSPGGQDHRHTNLDFFLLFGTWTAMMVAMMLPAVTPTVLVMAAISRRSRSQTSPFTASTWFLFGYLTIWTLFSAAAALGQVVLHGFALLNAEMAIATPQMCGCLLVLAGAFQFSFWKKACLRHCRSPLAFLMTQWRPGSLGSFKMGIVHGAYCTGCCWALMLLMFVAGVMNIWCFLALTGFVLIEKVQRHGMIVGRIAGVVLFLWGILLLVRS